MSGKILILGAGGRLGAMLTTIGADRVVGVARGAVDITHPANVAAALATFAPAAVINAAAIADVDRCEREPETAMRVNEFAPGVLARACRDRAIACVHVSTDYVFGGDGLVRPRCESDAPAPVNMYGRSKLAGERAVLDSGAKACVVRTAWICGFAGDFATRMITRARSGERLRVTDQAGAPTPIKALASALIGIASRLQAGLATPTVLHVAGSPVTTRYDWVKTALIAHGLLDEADAMERVTLSALAQSGATRPQATPLDSSVYARLFAAPIDWRAAYPCAGA